MTRFLPLAALAMAAALAGCNSDGTMNAQGQTFVNVACAADAVGQPTAVTIVPVLLPQATPGAALDAALVHPAVVAACAQYGKPVAVAPTPVVAPAVAPVAAVVPAKS